MHCPLLRHFPLWGWRLLPLPQTFFPVRMGTLPSPHPTLLGAFGTSILAPAALDHWTPHFWNSGYALYAIESKLSSEMYFSVCSCPSLHFLLSFDHFSSPSLPPLFSLPFPSPRSAPLNPAKMCASLYCKRISWYIWSSSDASCGGKCNSISTRQKQYIEILRDIFYNFISGMGF